MSSKPVTKNLTKASYFLSRLVSTRPSSLMSCAAMSIRTPISTTLPSTSFPTVSVYTRTFTSSPALYKKGGAKASKNDKNSKHSKSSPSAAAEEEEATPILDLIKLDEITSKMEASLAHFKDRCAVLRQGKYTPAALEEIIVSTSAHTEEPIKNIARVALKGPRNITITAFDTHNVKHIISAVLAANLNLNPQPDPKQEQVLRVPLPPSTSETKKEIAKNIKNEYEHWRNSKTKRSLISIREDAMKVLKKAGASKDEERTIKNKIEEIFKNNANKLAEILKQAEAATMKE